MARPCDLIGDGAAYRAAIVDASRGDIVSQRRLALCFLDLVEARPDNAEPLAIHALHWARMAEANSGDIADKGLLMMALGVSARLTSWAGEDLAAHWIAAEGLAVANDVCDAAVGTSFDGWADVLLSSVVERGPPDLAASAQYIRRECL